MLKNLFDPNSPQTTWLREHRLIVGVIGGLVSLVAIVPTTVAIIKERRK